MRVSEPLRTPVVLIVFNRPRVTRRNVAALRAARPEELFVIADGPRANRPDDAALCDQVRAVVSDLDWPVRLHTRFAQRNLGLEANVELGMDWVFSQAQRAIVLEDDCIPDPTFFGYCEQLLDRYEAEPRVWLVSGDNHGVPGQLFAGASYAFSTWASVWGWATWADRWHRHRAEFPRDHAGAEDRYDRLPRTADAYRPAPAIPHGGALVTQAARRHFADVAANPDGDARGWDHHWWVSIMAAGGLSAVPAANLVENDGFGDDATHTRAAKEPDPAVPMRFPMVHPPLALNADVERELELILLRTDGRLSRLARRVIRPLWLRSVVRRLIAFPPVWRAVRRLVGR
ncbi:MAG: glycosyltransferase [Jatrophihabitans sp.]|nr:MAG: glycosyltransferase [Jatrophihabitans sp.]